MQLKVIRGILIYNGQIYHEGDHVEVGDERKRQRMIQDGIVVDSPNPDFNLIKKKPKKGVRKHNGEHNKL